MMAQTLHVADIGVRVHLRAIPLAGTIEDLEAGVTELALAISTRLTFA